MFVILKQEFYEKCDHYFLLATGTETFRTKTIIVTVQAGLPERR